MAVGRLLAQAGRGVALRIEIDQQRARAGLGQADGQIDGRGRLADAAFLIRHAQDPAHRMPPSRPKIRGPDCNRAANRLNVN